MNTDVRRRNESSPPKTVTSRIVDGLPNGARSEVGSRIDTDGNGNGGFRRNTVISQAAEVTYLVDQLAPSRRQIDRVYYYSLCAPEYRSTLTTSFHSDLSGDRPLKLDPGPCAVQQPRNAYSICQRKTGGPPAP